MYCKNCGKELDADALFCPDCGTGKMESQNESNAQDTAVEQAQREVNMETESEGSELKKKEVKEESLKEEQGGGLMSKIWNSQLFTKVAVKFGNLLLILEGIIVLILSRLLFREGGFGGNVFGVLFLLGGIGYCIGGVKSFFSIGKSSQKEEDEADLKKKKRNLCIGVPIIIIAILMFKNTGGGTYSIVKAITFDNLGSETIGELMDRNIKGQEWSQKKLDSNSKLVYVEGYCPAYDETIRITFYYEKSDDTYEVSLKGINWPDSDKELSAWEAAVVWASFYSESE